MLLLPLDLLPEIQRLPGVGEPVRRPKNMGMPQDQLFADAGADIVHIEGPRLSGDLGMEDHLQQNIPQLLAEMGVVPLVDGFRRFIGLFDEIPPDALMGLGQIPGAAALFLPQPRHDLQQVLKAVVRLF